MKRAKSIKTGDAVAITAPSTVVDPAELKKGIEALSILGYPVQVAHDLSTRRERYLAGNDETRADELVKYFAEKEIKAIFCARGGYGSSRTIPYLDIKTIKKNPKLFIGYSDITSLHLLLNQKCKLVTIYGAHPNELQDMDEKERAIFIQMISSPDPIGELSSDRVEALAPGQAMGKLTGGCLTLIISSLGTPYEIETDGKILFIEDHNVKPYQLDRMLTQLKHAGKFKRLKGIIFGNMNNCNDKEHNYIWQDVVRSVLTGSDIPIIANFPAGHGIGKISLPLGTIVEINAKKRSITLLESATEE